VDCFSSKFGPGICPNPNDEHEYYRKKASLKVAIEAAAMAERAPDGKRHSHQYRIAKVDLETWRDTLTANQNHLGHVKDFNSLHGLLLKLKTPGVGALAIYDTALRIGYFLGMFPQQVFLHAGTAVGASQFIEIRQRNSIKVNELPPAFKKLKPHQIEDCLCICKNQFKWLRINGKL
jgi:hypothetical protein